MLLKFLAVSGFVACWLCIPNPLEAKTMKCKLKSWFNHRTMPKEVTITQLADFDANVLGTIEGFDKGKVYHATVEPLRKGRLKIEWVTRPFPWAREKFKMSQISVGYLRDVPITYRLTIAKHPEKSRLYYLVNEGDADERVGASGFCKMVRE